MIDAKTKNYVQAMENAGHKLSISFDEDGLATGVLTRFPSSPSAADAQACLSFLAEFPTAKQQSRAVYEFLRLRKLH